MKTQYKIGSLFLVAILGILIGYTVAQTGNTFIISQGVYPHGATYTIYKEGTIYYAKDAYGLIPSWGANTDASTLIEKVLNVSIYGGRIFIKRGDYIITSTINVYHKYFTIVGEGCGSSGTRLRLDNNVNVNMFNLNSSTFFYLCDISLDGNSANNNAGIGISASATTGGQPTADITLERVFIHHFGDEGLYWTDCWGSVIRNCYIEANLGNGSVLGGWNLHIEGTTFNWNTGSGLRLGGDFHTSIIDSAICENGEHGIHITGGSTTIQGNKILGNSINSNDTYSGIYIYGGMMHTVVGNLIDGRTIKNPPRYEATRHGIRVENCVNGTTIEGNTIIRTLSTGIYTSVSDKTHIENNVGFITERGGTSEASNDDYISFGVTFADTPQTIILTVQESDARYITQVKTKNVTHFQLYLYDETAGALEDTDKTISWYAEFKP